MRNLILGLSMFVTLSTLATNNNVDKPFKAVKEKLFCGPTYRVENRCSSAVIRSITMARWDQPTLYYQYTNVNIQPGQTWYQPNYMGAGTFFVWLDIDNNSDNSSVQVDSNNEKITCDNLTQYGQGSVEFFAGCATDYVIYTQDSYCFD